MATTINDKYEYVSAGMDNEDLSAEMLDKLLADDEAAQKWYEYHLMGDYIRHGKEAVGKDASFLHDVAFQSELAKISAAHRSRCAGSAAVPIIGPSSNHSFKFFAVAASMAAIAVATWQFVPQQAEAMDAPAFVEEKAPAMPARPAEIVNVNANAENKSASQPQEIQNLVVPDAAKDHLPEKQAAVRVDTQKISQQQTIVQ